MKENESTPQPRKHEIEKTPKNMSLAEITGSSERVKPQTHPDEWGKPLEILMAIFSAEANKRA
jgi:hypothetical protein